MSWHLLPISGGAAPSFFKKVEITPVKKTQQKESAPSFARSAVILEYQPVLLFLKKERLAFGEASRSQ
jgi:hypothetical protein